MILQPITNTESWPPSNGFTNITIDSIFGKSAKPSPYYRPVSVTAYVQRVNIHKQYCRAQATGGRVKGVSVSQAGSERGLTSGDAPPAALQGIRAVVLIGTFIFYDCPSKPRNRPAVSSGQRGVASDITHISATSSGQKGVATDETR